MRDVTAALEQYPSAEPTWWKVSAVVRREIRVFAKGWFAARAAGAAEIGALVEECKVVPAQAPVEFAESLGRLA
jgi:hypothetical protein